MCVCNTGCHVFRETKKRTTVIFPVSLFHLAASFFFAFTVEQYRPFSHVDLPNTGVIDKKANDYILLRSASAGLMLLTSWHAQM